MDTIFASATAPGRAGVAIVRLSGPEALSVAQSLAGDLPEHGRGLRRLVDGDDVLDEALVLTFAAGRSFTGEPVVEFHLHGSPAVVAALLRVLGSRPGLRMAEAGEFTRRALENGRLDLAEVEGLADLIDAETEAQRRQALRVFSGAMGGKVEAWRRMAIRALALIEATIDFADEDVPVNVMPEVQQTVDRLVEELEREVAGVAVAERVRSGFEVALIGAPNVGKSTLLNRLAGREAAITSTIAGTTRDVIEVRMDLRGLPVTLLDTAGLREATDEIERLGIERTLERGKLADLRVRLVEGPEEAGDGELVVLAKDDDGSRGGVSGRTGAGVDRLVDAVVDRLAGRLSAIGVAMRERHRSAMDRALHHLCAVKGQAEMEIVAEEVRLAVRAIDSLVGRVDVEDVLGEIFASFCIGK
ncbi:tRNA uridine-5-carboxymethylaminomethyl(34) synthesis GTPase MnmE [Wenxinia marina]|uniref:tRNA modification GTPase MnmE n=1 Tax=Wenxinia marina DSM 24838 TaxID=1123501 RepID=A0A0D0Q9F9_9RHOB|nr:tRNA uridine-5-carboxymethylaminomethyl(34) synthesis GTPase MnmE [Wenxinia marina]KIQ71059.1 tRNA modification GTPase trmE [Wenxinia marina DSM 24838]GGL55207.1 tRNA modification GTPase MnmE [Wenxinia marina]